MKNDIKITPAYDFSNFWAKGNPNFFHTTQTFQQPLIPGSNIKLILLIYKKLMQMKINEATLENLNYWNKVFLLGKSWIDLVYLLLKKKFWSCYTQKLTQNFSQFQPTIISPQNLLTEGCKVWAYLRFFSVCYFFTFCWVLFFFLSVTCVEAYLGYRI